MKKRCYEICSLFVEEKKKDYPCLLIKEALVLKPTYKAEDMRDKQSVLYPNAHYYLYPINIHIPFGSLKWFIEVSLYIYIYPLVMVDPSFALPIGPSLCRVP